MKKAIIGFSVFLIAGLVLAGMDTNRVPVGTNSFVSLPGSMDWPAGKRHINNQFSTLNAGFVTNATWNFQYGKVTNNGAITFTKAYSSAPAVVVTWDAVRSANAGLVTNAIKVFSHPTVFTAVCSTVVATDMWWMAIGPCSP